MTVSKSLYEKQHGKEKNKESKIEKKAKQNSYKIAKVLISLTVILSTLTLIAFIVLGISSNNKELLIPTTTRSTTTKSGNMTSLSIGQYCSYNNECPELAFCSGTCQCPSHYYFNTITAKCELRKTRNAACTSDFECNQFAGLRCLSSICNCDTNDYFWNSTFLFAGGLPLGRCQLKKTHGMACTASEGVQGSNYVSHFNSQIRRCWCEIAWNWYLSLTQGSCVFNFRRNEVCYHNQECHQWNAMCMDVNRDGIKRCVPVPTIAWYGGYYTKYDFNQGWCNSNYQCNENKNYVCLPSTSRCACLDDNYYYNGSMCIFGRRYGEPCSSSSQCTPTSSGFVCDFPFTGALLTECRCAIGTRYYDLQTETCQPLKSINATCRDSQECSGSATNTMFCGSYEGGSQRVCLCADGFYWSGSTCTAKLVYNSACSFSYQCMDHLNQTCISSRCLCPTGQYLASDNTCQYKKYRTDSCSTGSECWSNTCTSSRCT